MCISLHSIPSSSHQRFLTQDTHITLLCLLNVIRILNCFLCSQYPQLYQTIPLCFSYPWHHCSWRDEPCLSAWHYSYSPRCFCGALRELLWYWHKHRQASLPLLLIHCQCKHSNHNFILKCTLSPSFSFCFVFSTMPALLFLLEFGQALKYLDNIRRDSFTIFRVACK